ncbi:hypothetical protein pipiens_015183, partial [Culex pipiens pipiens]
VLHIIAQRNFSKHVG